MECPHCGSLNSKVVDSRLTSDRVSIRRRRKCLACWERFTTYESTEERILPILIRKKARYGATKASLKITLAFISKTLKDLSNETKKLVAQRNSARIPRRQISLDYGRSSRLQRGCRELQRNLLWNARIVVV